MAATGVTTQFAYRTQKTIGLIDGHPQYSHQPGFNKPETNNRCCTYSPDGRYFSWACNEDVKIANPNTGEIVTTLPAQNVHEIGFSPRGSYIITWERPTKQEDGSASKNLRVWKTETAEHVVAFVQKSQSGWNLQYTYDEKYCARVVTNTVQFFESTNMNEVWKILRVEGVTEVALSPGKNYSVAAFVPERKGNPAVVKIFQVPNFDDVLSQKSFYKADRVQLKWNALGTSVLVFSQTDADKTGKSYYGETNLYLITVAGNYDCRVSLDKEGPIHDVAWSTDSKEFGVVYGFMPAKTTIFDARANIIHQLPAGPRNTILFSPHARLVLVAGFGNLQGSMDIYDRQAGMKKICTIEASNASVCEWSPDGRHILTATTSPRLRVDNGVKIWHYTGGLMYNIDLDELYHVTWLPQSASMHPLPSPLPPAPTPHESALTHVATTTPKKPAGAYRPPHARNTATPLHFKREDEGGAAHIYANGSGAGSGSGSNGLFSGKGRRREVPGAAPAEKLVPGAAPGGGVSLAGTGAGADEENLSRAAVKNKKKREAAKKAKAEQQQAANAAGNGIPQGPQPDREGREGNGRNPHQHHTRSKSRNNQQNEGHRRSKSKTGGENQNHHGRHHSEHQQLHIRTGADSLAPPIDPSTPQKRQTDLEAEPQTPDGTPSTQDKKLRGLHKKLRAIEDLKQRLANGEKLEDTQLRKIRTEEQVRKELNGLA
ncbi:unnamed protein product [Tuber melanosporum]|uniref:Eukaryotic translation initiation factor 2A n=1 Tax=Tuber melanosporum (strain Mel28) TaxID=656061 RepID=D5GDW5_TUBMM|nr:uncharacterized protein GSTUM_00006311001 [Tuber melanosporum]CAZ82708.1 unnamed protein product [Tuber melanosporum]